MGPNKTVKQEGGEADQKGKKTKKEVWEVVEARRGREPVWGRGAAFPSDNRAGTETRELTLHRPTRAKKDQKMPNKVNQKN